MKNTKTKSVIGRKAKFVYPNFGTPNGYPNYIKHSGQIVTIVSKLSRKVVDEDLVGEMFTIQAEDGWIGTAYRSELILKRT